ncbi:MAG: hypothetical protein OES53_05985 [Xanthomonadales bacterium]|jgi:hypothetical protein|nr:hypothetical protein [Xanthomonadales bacterium]MDH3926081.1 hypothetical protein [Xanthomonadales bacterium]MDH3941119.1 hypothetical protein [Xanthomonadales bacterium]MDH4002814.1 hypothetical protein [Xanthomonadales bacterium]
MKTASKPARRMASPEFPSLEAFEAGTLDHGAFDHVAHVFIAWRLLEENSLAQATGRFLAALKQLTQKLGIESKYHETISCFYLALIAERRSEMPGLNWETFAQQNPDLLVPAPKLLEKYYSPDRLWSDLARRQFLLPDRNPQAGNDLPT